MTASNAIVSRQYNSPSGNSVIATRNAHKVQELAPVLAPYWTVKCTADYPEMADTEIEESGDTFLANATLKAISTSLAVPDHVLADDSDRCKRHCY